MIRCAEAGLNEIPWDVVYGAPQLPNWWTVYTCAIFGVANLVHLRRHHCNRERCLKVNLIKDASYCTSIPGSGLGSTGFERVLCTI